MQRLIKIFVSIISTLDVSAHVGHLQVLTVLYLQITDLQIVQYSVLQENLMHFSVKLFCKI
jgi:hypothetical protein